MSMLPQLFLKTKLLPPRLGGQVIARPRLIERMLGMIDLPAAYSRATEVGEDGKIVYSQQLEGSPSYRSFRVPDLYTAPDN